MINYIGDEAKISDGTVWRILNGGGEYIKWSFSDGGREAAGFKGHAGDCVVRAIAIATELPYRTVYDDINLWSKKERRSTRRSRKSSARTGVYSATTRRYMESIGWKWTPTMKIGSGCTVHLRKDELPTGRIVVVVSKHLCAVVNGVIMDLDDPSRGGTRCVYGFFSKE